MYHSITTRKSLCIMKLVCVGKEEKVSAVCFLKIVAKTGWLYHSPPSIELASSKFLFSLRHLQLNIQPCVCVCPAGGGPAHAGPGLWRNAAGLCRRNQNGRYKSRLWQDHCHSSDFIWRVCHNALMQTHSLQLCAYFHFFFPKHRHSYIFGAPFFSAALPVTASCLLCLTSCNVWVDVKHKQISSIIAVSCLVEEDVQTKLFLLKGKTTS